MARRIKETDRFGIEADFAAGGNAGLVKGLAVGFFGLQTCIIGLEKGHKRIFAAQERLVGYQ